MPVTWEIRSQVLIVTLVGDYSFDEPVLAVNEAIADSGCQTGTSLLIDARFSKTSRSSEDFRERAKWLASLQDKGLSSRCAVVIGPEPHQFGMARMAATHHGLQGLDMEIFTDMGEALRWLSKTSSHNSGATSSQP